MLRLLRQHLCVFNQDVDDSSNLFKEPLLFFITAMQFLAQSLVKSYCLRECGLSKIVVSLLNSSVHTVQATPLEIIRKGDLPRLNA